MCLSAAADPKACGGIFIAASGEAIQFEPLQREQATGTNAVRGLQAVAPLTITADLWGWPNTHPHSSNPLIFKGVRYLARALL